MGAETKTCPHCDIPQGARDILDEIFAPDGSAMWWNARVATLGGERPREVYERDPQRVLNQLNALADGNFV